MILDRCPGMFEDAHGFHWWQVEFQQAILRVPATQGSLRMIPSGWRQQIGLTRDAGWRSCQPVVLFPPPPNALCTVNHEGRFLDEFERE